MNLLILGANSEVAYAVAKKFAKEQKVYLYLASRDTDLLEKKVQDIKIRYGVESQALFFDALDYASHKTFYEGLDHRPDGVVLTFGYLGDQIKSQNDFLEAQSIIETNYLSAVSILEIIAEDFQKRGPGFIIALSSVAGERGRQSNYIYGSAKGALTIYLSGLRNRLAKSNIHVTTVLPGFIRTKMTENIELPGMLTAAPEDVANDIYKAYLKKRDIIYSKWFWKWIMMIIKTIPEKVFKKMDL